MSDLFSNSLFQTLAWLFSIVLIFEWRASHWQSRHRRSLQVVFGLLLGAAGIFLSLPTFQDPNNPILKIQVGVFGLSGFFFGPTPILLAVLTNIGFGLAAGDLTTAAALAAAVTVGLVWRLNRRPGQPVGETSWRSLAGMAAVIHLAVLTVVFSMNSAAVVFTPLQITGTLIQPVATFFIGTLIIRHMRRENQIKQLCENTENLKKSEKLYRLLTESMKDVVWILDTETMHFRYISPSVEKLRGFTPEEVMAVSAYSALSPQSEITVKNNILALSDAYRQGKIPEDQYFTEDIEQPCKDGSTVWTEAITRFSINPDNNHVEVRGVTRDISARKKAELEREQALEALRKSDESYRQIFEHAADGIFITDQQGQFLAVNASACARLGYSLQEILKRSLPELVVTDQALNLSSQIIEIKMRHKHGTLIDVEASQQCLPDGRVQIVVRDITQRKIAEAQTQTAYTQMEEMLRSKDRSRLAMLSLIEDLKKTEEKLRLLNSELEDRVAVRTVQLEASNKELEAFAYSVSHDLRAPLRAIDGFSQILVQEYNDKLDAEGQHIIDVIRSSAKNMDHLITDLLSLSHVSRSELKHTPIDMADLAKSVFYELANSETQKKTSLQIDPLPAASGDPTLLRQVWVNLISNAIKYSAPKPECSIQIGSRQEADELIYIIKDNGVGFNPKYKARLFGVFSRLHKAEQFEGTGVGLAIVQRIIMRHGGKVWAESELGQGATFYFSLPLPKKTGLAYAKLHPSPARTQQ